MPDLNGRPYSRTKTGIEDLEKLQEVRRSLIRQDATDRLRQRARIRRQYNSPPLSQPIVDPTPAFAQTSEPSYAVNRYDPNSDRWQVSSLSAPSEQFLAYSLKKGGIEAGIVRGYPPVAIEPQPQGRRFPPVESPKKPKIKEEEIAVTIKVGYTGRL